MLTDESGTVVWKADYDPFGKATVNEDPDGDGNLVTLNMRFPGQYYDQETGLHYNAARYYDPSTGRYLTSDPIGLQGGLNTYLYVEANPLRFVDPTGLLSSKPSLPKWWPPAFFPDDLGQCREKTKNGILKKCLKIGNAVEKIACIDAWRNWEQACIGERACLSPDNKSPS